VISEVFRTNDDYQAYQDGLNLLVAGKPKEGHEHFAKLLKREPAHVRVLLRDGRVLRREKSDYLGFLTRPAGWDDVEDKFRRLAVPVAGEEAADRIVRAVADLEHIRVASLCSLLERVATTGLEG
jgi:2-methylcitrate dehydratase PrpD